MKEFCRRDNGIVAMFSEKVFLFFFFKRERDAYWNVYRWKYIMAGICFQVLWGGNVDGVDNGIGLAMT